jgi:putative hydrolase of the HAD superfamily
MVRAVVFDFGNVVARFEPRRIVENLVPHSTLPAKELAIALLANSDLGIRYETGKITSREFFAEASRILKLSCTESEFIDAFCRIFTPIEGTHALVRRLKGKVRLGLLSNTSEWHFLHGIRASAVFPLFEAVTLSYQVGAMKPDPAIFRDMLSKLALPADECAYTDDIPEFVEAARSLGCKAVQFTTPEALEAALDRMGVGS